MAILRHALFHFQKYGRYIARGSIHSFQDGVSRLDVGCSFGYGEDFTRFRWGRLRCYMLGYLLIASMKRFTIMISYKLLNVDIYI